MASTFKRLTARGVGAARTRVGAYTVPAGTSAVLIGASVANVTAGAVTATIEHYDGTNYTVLGGKAVPLEVGQAFAPSEIGKTVLQPGDGLFVTSGTAAALDVVLSILEIV